jgi:hypothetical protein
MVAPTTRNDFNRAGDSFTPWIRVRLQRENATSRGERFEHRVDVALLRFVGATDRVHEEDEIWRADFSMFMVDCRPDRSDSIDGWRTNKMNTRRILAKALDARGTLCTRWKVDVCKFGDRVAHRFVRNTFCAITAVDVRNANAANRRRTRCSKRFDPITEDDDKIR